MSFYFKDNCSFIRYYFKFKVKIYIYFDTITKLMFLFSCCTTHEGDYTYEIRKDFNKVKNVSDASDLHEKINDSNQYVTKIKKSNF